MRNMHFTIPYKALCLHITTHALKWVFSKRMFTARSGERMFYKTPVLRTLLDVRKHALMNVRLTCITRFTPLLYVKRTFNISFQKRMFYAWCTFSCVQVNGDAWFHLHGIHWSVWNRLGLKNSKWKYMSQAGFEPTPCHAMTSEIAYRPLGHDALMIICELMSYRIVG